MPSLHEILQPQVILNVISRIRDPNNRLCRFFGMNPGGNAIRNIKGRYATFRIFDHTRTIAMGRAPGAGPATVPMNPIGTVPVQIARFYEKIPLDYESLGNLSPLAGPNAQVDRMGEDYIARQEGYLAQRFNNVMEMMVAGMIRGQFYLKFTGENFIPTLTSPSLGVTVNYQIPSGNKSQLDMLGAGSIINSYWSDPGTSILKHLSMIKQAFMQLHGYQLRHILVNSNTWYQVITNTEVRNVGGVMHEPFSTYTSVKEKGSDGEDIAEYAAVLRADPTIQWHIMDHVLAPDGTDPSYAAGTATLVSIIPDNVAVFLPEPSSMWAQMAYGTEPLVETIGMPVKEVQGLHFYSKYTDSPGAIEIHGLLNALPCLYIPKAIAYANVSGF